ncbi:MAG: hypothetical protein BRD55_09810 [Bacteroidetes bacterium SW_9_63_38]|nr:MAG: hypothetical protein BRD55_09810 [Bacteroidetes bacterium SW_9_63_38]
MTIPNLTRENIQAHTADGSFERGQEYLSDGAVRSIKRPDEHTLKAQVQGSDVHPYLVQIRFDENDIRKVQCTCPYHEGSWCKHIVAVLLKTLTQEEIPVSESTRVRSLTQDLERDEIVTLLERLVEHDPQLLEQVKTERSRLAG